MSGPVFSSASRSGRHRADSWPLEGDLRDPTRGSAQHRAFARIQIALEADNVALSLVHVRYRGVVLPSRVGVDGAKRELVV
jgi:hypothetical protein